MLDTSSARVDSAFNMLGLDRLNTHARRPFVDRDGRPRVLNANGVKLHTNAPALLQYDEWKDIDRTVIAVATDRLVGIADLISKGLTHALGSIGQTISLWDKSSDMTQAAISMSGVTKGEKDTPAYETAQVPVPIIHKEFSFNLRRLAASRIHGESLDVTAAALASRVVSERSEDMLFSGAAIVVDGGTIFGYLNHPQRNTVALAEQWDNPATTGQDIYEDVEAMIVAIRADNYYGPFTLYIPGTYEGVMDRDFAPGSGDIRTVRQRIMQISGIKEITVVDRLPNHNVVLVQLARDIVDLAIAQDITTVQWSNDGGMSEEFKTMAIWVPRVKSDFDGRSGVAHLS